MSQVSVPKIGVNVYEERGISFDQIYVNIESGYLLDVIPYPCKSNILCYNYKDV